MIDSAKTDVSDQPMSSYPMHNPTHTRDPTSWIGTTASTVLAVNLSLYLHFRKVGLCTALLPEVLSSLEGCICQDIESLARMGMQALHDLLIKLDPENHGLDRSTSDLVCQRVTGIVLANLCLNFGECGRINVQCDPLVPSEVSKLLTTCPITARRRFKDVGQASDAGDALITPYGIGRKLQVMCHDMGLTSLLSFTSSALQMCGLFFNSK